MSLIYFLYNVGQIGVPDYAGVSRKWNESSGHQTFSDKATFDPFSTLNYDFHQTFPRFWFFNSTLWFLGAFSCSFHQNNKQILQKLRERGQSARKEELVNFLWSVELVDFGYFFLEWG